MSGLHARRPYFGSPPTQACRLRRMVWFSSEAVETSPFTDKSLFTLFFLPDARRRVYRRREELFPDACVDERDRFGYSSVMAWGGIAHRVKSKLIVEEGNMTAVRYRDEIHRPVAVALVQQRQLILQ